MNVDWTIQIWGDALYALLELHLTLKLIDSAIFIYIWSNEVTLIS